MTLLNIQLLMKLNESYSETFILYGVLYSCIIFFSLSSISSFPCEGTDIAELGTRNVLLVSRSSPEQRVSQQHGTSHW